MSINQELKTGTPRNGYVVLLIAPAIVAREEYYADRKAQLSKELVQKENVAPGRIKGIELKKCGTSYDVNQEIQCHLSSGECVAVYAIGFTKSQLANIEKSVSSYTAAQVQPMDLPLLKAKIQRSKNNSSSFAISPQVAAA